MLTGWMSGLDCGCSMATTEQRDPMVILLSALCKGHQVVINGACYRMSRDGKLAKQFVSSGRGGETVLWLNVDCDLSDLKQMADDLGERGLIELAANVAWRESEW